MAKQRTDTEAVIKLVLDGKQAKTSGKELEDTFRKLRAELKKMKEEDDPVAYRKKAEELKKVAAAWGNIRKELNGATTEARSFKDELKDMASNAIGGLSMAGLAYAAVNGVKTLVSKNAELSDSYARVQKTTGLTEEAVDRLNDKFKKMNTRTANSELLGLAEVAGKLGISAEKDVEGFVRAADRIGVALGEDLGGTEEAINSLGKLTDIFKLKDTFGIEEALNKVGSAINTLGATGTAAEKNLVDFANRMAGVAPAAGMTIDQVLGIAAVMDEMGQSMESSSTAIGQFIVGIGADIPKYAKVAGMSVKEFSALLKNDANEALLRVLDKAKSAGGGLEVMAKNMGVLEVSGARGIQALNSMAENIDLVRRRQEDSKTALVEGTSVLNEFNTVNSTLGANLEKLSNRMSDLWQNGSARQWFTDITAKMLGTYSESRNLSNEWSILNDKQNVLERESKPLIKRYDELKSLTTRNKEEQEELRSVIDKLAKLVPTAVTEFNTYGEAIDINRGKVEKFSKAQKELVKSMHLESGITADQEYDEAQRQLDQLNKIQDNALNSRRTFVGKFSDIGVNGDGTKNWFGKLFNVGMNQNDIANSIEKRQSKISSLIMKQIEIAQRKSNDGLNLSPDQIKLLQKFTPDFFKNQNPYYKPEKSVNNTQTGGNVLKGDDKKGKSDAEKQIDQANEMYKKLIKASEDFGATQLLESLSQNDKELQAESDKYQKQIDQWEEFQDKRSEILKTKNEEQLLKDKDYSDAAGRIALLEVERESAVSALKVKQATETNEKIEELNTSLSNKHATELEKEKANINKFYNELKKNASSDANVQAKIEEERLKALADAEIREKERIKDETKRINDETEKSTSTRREKQLEKIRIAHTNELEALKAKFGAELLATEEFKEAEAALLAKYKVLEDNVELEKQKEKKSALLDIAQSTADAIFAIGANNRQSELDAVLSNIDKQRERELSNKNLTENQKKSINDKYDKQVKAEKLKAWKADQKASIIQSIINTALAVTKVIPNPFAMAAAAAAGLLQTGVIAAQKPPQFAKGGFIPDGPSHTQGGLDIVDRRNKLIANIEGGEPILSRATYANNKDVVDALIYASQRKNGASIGINSDAIVAEEASRRGSGGNVVVPPPVVNYTAGEQMSYEQFAKIMKGYVDDRISKIEVVQNYHLTQEHNQKIVSIENSVDS
ncbi:MAG: phage tail tape measure protein family [Sphingobacterium multivorum]|jgi:TP901 family phage tail tape measure protein|nr:phage tail tape measure protein family [Sphingobacterium multivorum]